jgi:cytochrome P450
MATVSAPITKPAVSLPPGPKGNFFLGSMPEMSRGWLKFYKRCARDYGDVVYFRLAHIPVYSLVHPRDIEYVLVKNAANFTKSADYGALRRIVGNGLLTSEGAFWRRQRSLIQPAFHRESILHYAPVMTGATTRMLDTWQDNEPRDIHKEMMRLTLEIVAQCLYSADVSGSADRVGHALEVVTSGFGKAAGRALLLPFYIPDPMAWRERRAIRELNQIIDGIIQQRRTSGRPHRDLLDTLLQARDADGEPMSDAQLRDEVMTLFLAGHETTALALSWACFLLGMNPQVESMLVEELRVVLGGRTPALEDLPRLRYTEMVVKEVMRLYPPVWGVGRRAIAECEIGGYRVKAGANIFILQWLTQRDARFFPDPERFDPERWREDPIRAGLVPRYAYFPFGGGPRVCVGAAFAMVEATLLLATIYQRYHLEIMPDPPVQAFPSVTLRPRYGIHATVRRRTSSLSPHSARELDEFQREGPGR